MEAIEENNKEWLKSRIIELETENTNLKDIYIRTAKHQKKIGHEELGNYMLAQIQAVPTFTTFEEYITWIQKEDLRSLLRKYEELKKEDNAIIHSFLSEIEQLLNKN